ncbi:hypothetical protein [Novosphingobium sp. Chol11]|uniref:hypothetical protein n=1 Tax=Novosphingobium sp. Chol11 TaxID=1385763 RepID=UPI0020D2310C|nr:hypothetical protein [Novosphingobium sp. Chol11]
MQSHVEDTATDIPCPKGGVRSDRERDGARRGVGQICQHQTGADPEDGVALVAPRDAPAKFVKRVAGGEALVRPGIQRQECSVEDVNVGSPFRTTKEQEPLTSPGMWAGTVKPSPIP